MGDSGRVILRADRSCGAKPLKHTPLFFWGISCPAPIMGESSCSRRRLCLDETAFPCSIPQFPNDSQAKICDRPRFEIRAENRRFACYSWWEDLKTGTGRIWLWCRVRGFDPVISGRGPGMLKLDSRMV